MKIEVNDNNICLCVYKILLPPSRIKRPNFFFKMFHNKCPIFIFVAIFILFFHLYPHNLFTQLLLEIEEIRKDLHWELMNYYATFPLILPV